MTVTHNMAAVEIACSEMTDYMQALQFVRYECQYDLKTAIFAIDSYCILNRDCKIMMAAGEPMDVEKRFIDRQRRYSKD